MDLDWKMDMDFKCPYCGYVYDTTAYLNVEDVDCPACDKTYNVRLKCDRFYTECTKTN